MSSPYTRELEII